MYTSTHNRHAPTQRSPHAGGSVGSTYLRSAKAKTRTRPLPAARPVRRCARPESLTALFSACWGSGDTVTTWDVPSEHDAPSVPSTVTRLHPLFGPPCTVGSTPLWARGTCEIQSLAWSHGLCPAGLPQRHAPPVHRAARLPERHGGGSRLLRARPADMNAPSGNTRDESCGRLMSTRRSSSRGHAPVPMRCGRCLATARSSGPGLWGGEPMRRDPRRARRRTPDPKRPLAFGSNQPHTADT
jgi:hypothetical protein